jgi:hypothetical protein
MGNTLTSLAADIYKAADIIGREPTGFISSVVMNSDAAKKIALNDTVRSHFTRAPTVNTSYTPSMTIPEGDDQTVDNKTMSITQVARVSIPWTGEDIKHVNNGSGFSTIYGDQIAQAMRSITNTIEAYLALQLSKNYSRAYGSPGTTPFASNFNEMANLRKILVDNGCPMDGQVCAVINTTASTNLRNLAQLQKVNESGTTDTLRRGELLNLQGISLKESAGIVSHTKGTNDGNYLINLVAGYAIGDGCFGKTNDHLVVDTGAGTILAGDYLVFGTDTNKHGVTTALSAGNVTIGETGLQVAAANNLSFVGPSANFTPNMVFHRNAAELVVRAPAQPPGGDAATDRMTVQDPYSGMVYELAVYKGYGKMMLDITTFYDAKVWKPAFVACLLG